MADRDKDMMMGRDSWFWGIVLLIAVALVVVAFLVSLGMFTVSSLTLTIIYTVAVVLLVMTLLHWINIF